MPQTVFVKTQGPGGPPTQFSTVAATITGDIDGENDTFTLASSPTSVLIVYVNQGRLVIGLGFTWTPGTPTLKFNPAYIPQPGAVISAEGW